MPARSNTGCSPSWPSFCQIQIHSLSQQTSELSSASTVRFASIFIYFFGKTENYLFKKLPEGPASTHKWIIIRLQQQHRNIHLSHTHKHDTINPLKKKPKTRAELKPRQPHGHPRLQQIVTSRRHGTGPYITPTQSPPRSGDLDKMSNIHTTPSRRQRAKGREIRVLVILLMLVLDPPPSTAVSRRGCQVPSLLFRIFRHRG